MGTVLILTRSSGVEAEAGCSTTVGGVWERDSAGTGLLSLPRKLIVSINSSALSFLSLRILGAVVQLDTHCRVVLVCNFFGRLSAV